MGVFDTRPETVQCRLTASPALQRVSLGSFVRVGAWMELVLHKGTGGMFGKF